MSSNYLQKCLQLASNNRHRKDSFHAVVDADEDADVATGDVAEAATIKVVAEGCTDNSTHPQKIL
eukprot:m.394829 g.394829  ORF g.394829 m.394829 type:complete len:65 (+) comp21094_c1_seq3:249-443(+)